MAYLNHNGNGRHPRGRNGNGGRLGRRELRRTIHGLVGDLYAADQLKRETLKLVAEQRQQIYRQAKVHGISAVMLRIMLEN